MIRISLIDDELSVYKNNKVILFGAGYRGRQIKEELYAFGVTVHAFCDNDIRKIDSIYEGVKVLQPSALCTLDDIVVQVACENENEIESQLNEIGITNYISFQEYHRRIANLLEYKLLNINKSAINIMEELQCFHHTITQDSWPIWFNAAYCNLYNQELIVLCMPTKTGDYSLETIFNQGRVPHVNLWHSLHHLDEIRRLSPKSEIKIITAVRDPISQNISDFFQNLDGFWDMNIFWEKGGDAQVLFDKWIDMELYGESEDADFKCFKVMKKTEQIEYIIQEFFEKQIEKYSGINVFSSEFDYESGYKIYKKEDISVFLFRTDKIDNVIGALSSFVGKKLDKVPAQNSGEKKWYKKAYVQAQEELKLQRRYFDDCMNSRIMNHFFSEREKDTIKERWARHLENKN